MYTCRNECRVTVLCFVVTSVRQVNSVTAYFCSHPLCAHASHCTATSWIKRLAAGCTDSPMQIENMGSITNFKILLFPHVLYLATVQ